MIVLNDLLGYNKKIYQDTEYFKFSIDGVLLASFVDIKLRTKKILEIGSGTGVISLILTTKTNLLLDSVEIQKELFDLFKMSIEYNKLQSQINLINIDVKEYSKNLNNLNKYDIIVSNPPYYDGKDNKNLQVSIAKKNIFLNLEDVILCSKKMLKSKGSLYLVYDAKKIDIVLEKLKSNNLIPKRVKFVYANKKSDASIVLIESVKNGNSSIKIESPFILYDTNNNKTEEYEKMFLESK